MANNHNIIDPLLINTALHHYNLFIENYSKSHSYNGKLYTHSIPSSFVYNAINDGCLWLLTLIVGVAGYSIYFDDDTTTSRVLSLELLNRANVKDPALTINNSITPWEGLITEERTPLSPVDHLSDGIGIPYINGASLLNLYKGKPIQALLPEIDPNTGNIVYDGEGVMKVKNYTLCITDKFSKETLPLCGWGMQYGDETLPLECVSDNMISMNYATGAFNMVILKTNISGDEVKYIGSSYGKSILKTRYMSRLEATPFISYCDYHLNREIDRFYIPSYWMSKHWSPFITWRNGNKTNSIQSIMMSAVMDTLGGLNKEDMQGNSVSSIISNSLNLSLSPNEKDNYRKAIVNTQRIISLLEFIKRV